MTVGHYEKAWLWEIISKVFFPPPPPEKTFSSDPRSQGSKSEGVTNPFPSYRI